MTEGLSVSRVVDVDVSFSPVAVPNVNFDTLLILGDSDVIDTSEVIREYNTIEEVAGDFGTTAPEYLAALKFFGQTPKPSVLYIGRWAYTATHGVLVGGDLTSAEQLIGAWNAITNGGFHITVDGGVSTNITGLNFSGATNLNGVATIISAALATATLAATCTWTGTHFLIKSTATGTGSSISYLTAPTAGTDISDDLKMTAALAARNVSGMAAETPVACVTRVDGRGWYACMFAASVTLNTSQHLAVSAYIEAAADKHLYGITTNDVNCVNSGSSSDVMSQASLAEYLRTVIQYSADPYAIASFFGRAFTVNFDGSNTTITMKFKREPGVIPEILSATQASTLKAKRGNVYVQYNNGVAIIEEGVMSGPAFFDEIHGTDWLANRIQTSIFNKLYRAPKIAQTNPGVHVLVTTAEGDLAQAINNGLIAPGFWNAPGFGTLNDGDYMPKGWFTFAQSVDDQNQAEREQRIAPLIQIAIKLAAAVHQANVLLNVNR